MDKFTKMTIYMVVYHCFKGEIHIDEYPVGYFVSKDEARNFVINDITVCGNVSMIQEPYQIIGIDKDPDYKHVYKLTKIHVGQLCPITSLTSWE